ncbi:unnamed protein product [Parascedosporium putredinis]|uniref:Uncharacterized protein n=1 Tax=Parascedosporium putredinis TaxID=1442378 RepID=A0A9P1H6T5_9PEZI|nr:unnamed protein product [Parascedosporium putredinis]CAI8000636.1 unnamed protein product [Parascedosporium putredinis]
MGTNADDVPAASVVNLEKTPADASAATNTSVGDAPPVAFFFTTLTTDPVAMYRCNVCGKTYAGRTSLARHALNHQKQKQHICETCGVVFYRRDLLSRHLKLHTRAPSASGGGSAQSAGSGEGNPEPRKRCHTACNRCRELRIRCSGASPCEACFKADQPCEYDGPSRRLSHLPARLPTADREVDSSTGPKDMDCSRQSFDYEGNPEASSSILLASPDDAGPDHPAISAPSDTTLRAPAPPLPNLPATECHAMVNVNNVEALDAMDLELHPQHVDPVFWPWLHENLYLPSSYDELIFGTLQGPGLLNAPPPGDSAAGRGRSRLLTQRLHGEVYTRVDHSEGPGAGGPGMTPHTHAHIGEALPPNNNADDDNGNNGGPYPKDASRRSDSSYAGHAGRIRVVDELVGFASCYRGERPGTTANHAAHWRAMSYKVKEAFEIHADAAPADTPLLDHFVHLFVQHFEPLWPLFSPQTLDIHQLHPLLYLVLTTIGAMYHDDDPGSAAYGNMMHGSARTCLMSPLELDSPDGDLVWLAQARVSTQMATLYFGQPRAFSYAQHLGALLAAQARRMDLFSDAYAKRGAADFRNPVASDQDRLHAWLRLETRRRLAFAIFRAESYTSVLLHARPLVWLGEIDLAFPSCETVWRSEKLPPRLCLQLIENDRTPGRDLRASDEMLLGDDSEETRFPTASAAATSALQLDGSVTAGSATGIPSPGMSSIGAESTQSQSQSNNHNHQQQQQQQQRTTLLATNARPLNLPPHPWSEVERLESAPRRMADMAAGHARLLRAWQKWEAGVPWVKSLVRTDADRSSLMSSLLFYHLAFVHLSCPVSSLHQIQYGLADGRAPEPDHLALAYRWARSSRGRLTAERAMSICSLIGKQGPDARRRRAADVKFNLLAYIALHRAIVVLWAFAGASDSGNGLGPAAGTGGWRRAHAGGVGVAEIPVNRENSASMIRCLNSYSPPCPASPPHIRHQLGIRKPLHALPGFLLRRPREQRTQDGAHLGDEFRDQSFSRPTIEQLPVLAAKDGSQRVDHRVGSQLSELGLP